MNKITKMFAFSSLASGWQQQSAIKLPVSSAVRFSSFLYVKAAAGFFEEHLNEKRFHDLA